MAAIGARAARVSFLVKVGPFQNHLAAQGGKILDVDYANLVRLTGSEGFQRARIVLSAIAYLGPRSALLDCPHDLVNEGNHCFVVATQQRTNHPQACRLARPATARLGRRLFSCQCARDT